MNISPSSSSTDSNNDTTAPILLEELDGGVLRLTLNRPQVGNCLNLDLLKKLTEVVLDAGDKPAIKVIIIAANGSLFCSGHDLKEMTARRKDADKGTEFFKATLNACSTMMQAIVHCPKPIIAEVAKPAFAAGAQLVASCDLAIASDQAGFCLPGVNIGLFCSTPMVAVSRNLSHKHTMELLLTGDMITAERAYEMGLINRVVVLESIKDETKALADKIASKSQAVLKIGKRAFYEQAEMNLISAYEYTSQVMVENMLHNAAEEGIDAFLEKRAPVWPDIDE